MKKKAAALRLIITLLLLITSLSLVDFAKANPPDQSGYTPPPQNHINVTSNFVFTHDFFDSHLEVQSDNIVIDGAGFVIESSSSYYNGINLKNVKNVTITNLTIKSFCRAVNVEGDSSHIVVRNCTLIWSPIFVENSDDNTICDNTFNDYSGIKIINSNNNTIMRNHFYNTLVTIQNSRSNIVSENSFKDCLFAINLVTSYNNRIMSNAVSNGYLGIILENSSVNVLFANTINGTSVCGMEIYDYSLSNNITKNSLSNNAVGFRIRNSKVIMLANFSGKNLYSNFFSQNDVYGNNASITAKWDLPDPVSKNLMTNSHKIPILLFGNYWSDYKGRDDDGDGVGDIRYSPIDPFYADSVPLIVPISVRDPTLPLPKIPAIDIPYDEKTASIPIVYVNELIQWSVVGAIVLAITTIIGLFFIRHRKPANFVK